MVARGCLGIGLALAATFVGITRAQAATIDYSFTGNPADEFIVSLPPGYPWLDHRIPIADTATGLNVLPAVVLATGETVDAKVNFSSPLTVPASPKDADIYLSLWSTPSPAVIFSFTESVSYYDKGVLVSPPSGFDTAESSGGGLILAQGSALPTPGFAFDEVVYSATINSIESVPGTSVSSIATNPNQYVSFDAQTYPLPTPLPAGFWLMLSGLGGLGLLVRKRSALTSPAT